MTLTDDISFYEQDGSVKSFTVSNGTTRRYFTWPMIAKRIAFQTQQLSQIESITILGGSMRACRLQLELPGRTWWKLVKTAVNTVDPFDLMRNYGVWNDENQQARVGDNALTYKNKLVDEWESLNINRVELNITQLVNGQPQVVYSAVYNGISSTKLNWISQIMFIVVDPTNVRLISWTDIALNYPQGVCYYRIISMS